MGTNCSKCCACDEDNTEKNLVTQDGRTNNHNPIKY
jgi:hypothetical protein